MKRSMVLIMLTALLLPAFSAEFATRPPKNYTEEQSKSYRAAEKEGYEQLDEGNLEGAIASFKKQIDVAPEVPFGYYNTACAYARSGHAKEGLVWIAKAVDHGFETARRLLNDDDLKSIAGTPEFAKMVARAEANHEAYQAYFTKGLPEPGEVPSFDNMDDFEAWKKEHSESRRFSSRLWTPSQYSMAVLKTMSRELAARKHIEKDNAGWNYNLERLRAIARMGNPYQAWGGLAKGVVKEAKTYLNGTTSPEGKAQAHYLMGMASFCEHLPTEKSDPHWASAVKGARTHFAHIADDEAYGMAVKAWDFHFRLREEGFAKVKKDLSTFSAKLIEDKRALSLASALFQSEAVAANWPIALDARDIDGNPVSLDDYKGKVLLIDFWATWCGPCRAELPNLREAYAKYKEQGFEILSISLDYPDDKDQKAYRMWTKREKMNWRHVYDEKNWQSPITKSFMVRGIPSPFLVGRDGEIITDATLYGKDLIKNVGKAINQ